MVVISELASATIFFTDIVIFCAIWFTPLTVWWPKNCKLQLFSCFFSGLIRRMRLIACSILFWEARRPKIDCRFDNRRVPPASANAGAARHLYKDARARGLRQSQFQDLER